MTGNTSRPGSYWPGECGICLLVIAPVSLFLMLLRAQRWAPRK